METYTGMGGMLMRRYSMVNPGSSRLAEAMFANNEPVVGSENVVKKRKKKRDMGGPIESAKTGVAKNAGETKEGLFP